jgi:hypothetical protein
MHEEVVIRHAASNQLQRNASHCKPPAAPKRPPDRRQTAPAPACAYPALRLAITDEASPFALRSTRNRPRTAVHRLLVPTLRNATAQAPRGAFKAPRAHRRGGMGVYSGAYHASSSSDRIVWFLANLWQTAIGSAPGTRQARRHTPPGLLVCGGAPRRNRTGDPILTMEPPGTAVRTAVPAGHARPSGSKLSVLFRLGYVFSGVPRALPTWLNQAGYLQTSTESTLPGTAGRTFRSQDYGRLT